jgi:hypothetical protein
MTLAIAVGLVVWCHRWLEAGRAPLPRGTATRIRDGALRGRTLRSRQAIRPSVLTIARLSAMDGSALRVVPSDGVPRNAA